MVVVGGVTIRPNYTETAYIGGSPDPWSQGIGVFDLTNGEWADSYDADTAAYVTPDTVKEAIAQYGKYPKQWSCPNIEVWFRCEGEYTRTSQRQNTADLVMSKGTSAARTSSSSSGGDSKKRPSSNIGPIVGGVVGGVVVGALIAGIIYLVLRRRRKNNYKAWHDPTDD